MAIEWSGELLRDLLVTTKDGDWGKGEPTDGHVGYHVIRGSDFPDVRVGDLSNVPFRYLPEKTVARRTLVPNDVLIETAGGTKDRPTGRTLLVTPKILGGFNGPVTCASFARFLRFDQSKADPAFAFWFLQHLYEKGEMDQHQIQHTGVARFQYTKFAETQSIPLPPLPEQKAIAAVLGALDDKIELNRRMNATLEAMARALFQSWFENFDPVRAKAEGRPPAGLDEPTAALFPAQFQASGLGEIPQGWEVKRIEELALRIAMGPFGSNITRNNFIERGVPVIRGGNLTDGFVDDDFVFVSDEKAEQLKNSIAQRGDLVFTHRGTLGQIGMIPPDSAFPQYVVSQSQMLLRLDQNQIGSEHVYQFFRSSSGQQALLANTSQVGVPAIARPTTSLKAIQVVVPSHEVSLAFERQTLPLRRNISLNTKQSRTLATLRDTLLPRLLSGELSVNKSESIIS